MGSKGKDLMVDISVLQIKEQDGYIISLYENYDHRNDKIQKRLERINEADRVISAVAVPRFPMLAKHISKIFEKLTKVVKLEISFSNAGPLAQDRCGRMHYSITEIAKRKRDKQGDIIDRLTFFNPFFIFRTSEHLEKVLKDLVDFLTKEHGIIPINFNIFAEGKGEDGSISHEVYNFDKDPSKNPEDLSTTIIELLKDAFLKFS